MKPITILLITWAALAGAEEGPITTWRGPNYDGVMPATNTVRNFLYFDKEASLHPSFHKKVEPSQYVQGRFIVREQRKYVVTAQPGDTENVVWRTALPSWGQSTPVVVGDKVFVTCDAILQTEGQHQLVCVDVASGKLEWSKPIDHLLAWPDGAKKAKVLQIRKDEFEGWAEAMRVWNAVWWDNDKKGFYGSKGRDWSMGFNATATRRKAKVHPDRQAAYDQAVAEGYKKLKDGYHAEAGRFGHQERHASFERAARARAHVYSHNKDAPWYGGTMASVVGDGEAVYAVAAPDAVVSYDLEGNLRWAADMEVGARPGWHYQDIHRSMASPILVGDTLIHFNVDAVAVFAFDTATGKQRWRSVLPAEIEMTKNCVNGTNLIAHEYLKRDGKRWMPRGYMGHMGPGGTPVPMTLKDGTKEVPVVVLASGHVLRCDDGTCLGWFNTFWSGKATHGARGAMYGTGVAQDDVYVSPHLVATRLWLDDGTLRSEELWDKDPKEKGQHAPDSSLMGTPRGLIVSWGSQLGWRDGKVLVKDLRPGAHKYTSGCVTADGLLLWHGGFIGKRNNHTAPSFYQMDVDNPQDPRKHPNGSSGIGLIVEDGTNEIPDFEQRMIDRFGTNVIHSGWPHPTAFGNYIFIRTNTYLYCIGKGKWRSPW